MVASYSSRFRAATAMSRKRQRSVRTSSRIFAATYSVSVNMLSARHSVTRRSSPGQGRMGPKKCPVRWSRLFAGSRGGRITVSHAAPQAAASRSRRSLARTDWVNISRPPQSPSRVTVTDRASLSRISMSLSSWAVK